MPGPLLGSVGHQPPCAACPWREWPGLPASRLSLCAIVNLCSCGSEQLPVFCRCCCHCGHFAANHKAGSRVHIRNSCPMQSFVESSSWVWWRTPEIPTLGRPRQEEHHEFKASLDYIARPCLKKKGGGSLKGARVPLALGLGWRGWDGEFIAVGTKSDSCCLFSLFQ